ncbi:hypothetical protein CABS01_13114 [Colletotrichum abscissum]|uniref:uncharacterized protein n=1 Tax=Colletotrichum abscissum TaxID=1671311 RepID=UPI0027D5351B|nr:uncharacterized protein CABS01_13114 [Colletotrichum abscissum]KAK1486981.1 hypothetical protein CABS01_13114 [Colletotrichum abscissum]
MEMPSTKEEVSYRTGSDNADLASATPHNSAFLEKELGLGRLVQLTPRLWFAGRPTPTRPLHYQRILGREIVVAEQMDLHLVWTTGLIHIKPIPRFLLEPNFWTHYLSCQGHRCSRTTLTPCDRQRLWRCALGFLFSYAALICHESDFFLAKDNRLIPKEVEWDDWREFATELSTQTIYGQIDERFYYGELRLSRLNKLQYLASFSSYMPPWNRYGDFFHDQFAWLASTTVYIAVVLTAMQVGLATTDLADNAAFQSASYGFTIFSILAPLAAMALVLATFLYINLEDAADAAEKAAKVDGLENTSDEAKDDGQKAGKDLKEEANDTAKDGADELQETLDEAVEGAEEVEDNGEEDEDDGAEELEDAY